MRLTGSWLGKPHNSIQQPNLPSWISTRFLGRSRDQKSQSIIQSNAIGNKLVFSGLKVPVLHGQVKLRVQQAALKARLQQALHMPTLPKTNVDTVTVADKALRILDTMIEVCLLLLYCVPPAAQPSRGSSMQHGIRPSSGTFCISRDSQQLTQLPMGFAAALIT